MSAGKNKKWIFIVNPIAGNGFGKTMVPEIEKKIKQFQIDGEVILTGYPGHASEIARLYAEKGTGYIIAVGGDGTMNEVARPLINNRKITLGIVPAGSGNDFNQISGFPNRFNENDWEIFFSKNEIAMDAGIVNETVFLNGMGLGFDAEVAACNYTEDGKVKKGGKNKYIWHIVKTLLFFKEKRMVVITEKEHLETDCFINTIAVGRRFAGGFFLTPKAIANDGLLDVCAIKKLNLYHRFRLLLKVPKGTHLNDKRVKYFQVSSIDLEFPQKVPYHVDGELYFSNTFSIKVIPESINIIYNPDGDHYFDTKKGK